METLKTALELESNTQKYFNSLADKCNYNEGIRHILLMLAGEEGKLVEIISGKLKNTTPDLEDTDFFSKSKAIFKELKSRTNKFSCDIEQLNLYRNVQELMLRAKTLYETKMHGSEGETVKLFWLQITNEKKKQLILLDNIIELLLRSEQWVESAEFSHLMEDY